MSEMIDIYTKDGIKTGTISKKGYYTLSDNIPWIKCCTCFVIDEATNKILVEKRGNKGLDPGRLDLCSGHVKSNEYPFQSMRRELKEELGISLKDSENIVSIGKVNVDYTVLQDEASRMNLKCLTNIYALKLKDTSVLEADNNEVVGIGWLSFEEICQFIQHHMTRLPYDANLAEQYANIFETLEQYLFPKKSKERN